MNLFSKNMNDNVASYAFQFLRRVSASTSPMANVLRGTCRGIEYVLCSFLLRQKRTQPTAGTPKKATRKPSLRLAGMYIPFSGRSYDLLCATVVNSSGSLMGS